MSARQRKWVVPVQVTRDTWATVWATNAEDAERLIDEGSYESIELDGEVVAVDSTGTAVPEEE